MSMNAKLGVVGALASLVVGAAVACGGSTTTNTGSVQTEPNAVSPDQATNGGFLVTVSGEDLAATGYDFTADSKANGDPPAFVDGWEVRFDHVIVTVDNVHLNEDPDRDDANPENVGALVASGKGPWAVDVHLGGPIPGKSGSPDEKTVAITAFNTRANGDAFDPTQRYAFGYDTVAASAAATLVNLDAAGKALYEQAKAKGWAMIYQGTATYKGPAPAADSVFAKMPKQVKFTFGMKNPSSYINCQNTDLAQLPTGEFPRGVQASASKVTTAQITLHTDHAFWKKLNVEGTELHFDPIAASASTYGQPDAGVGEVTLDDLVDVDVTGFRTRGDEQLPARSVAPDYTAPAGQLAFDANGTEFTKANSFAAYIEYSATSANHLNADGQCKVKNNYSP